MSRQDSNDTRRTGQTRALDGVPADQVHQHVAAHLEQTAQQVERDCRWRLGPRCDVAVMLRDVASAVLRIRAELAAEAAAEAAETPYRLTADVELFLRGALAAQRR